MAPGHLVHLSRVWGSNHGGSMYSAALVKELERRGWIVTVVAEHFVVKAEPGRRVVLGGWFGSSANLWCHWKAFFRLCQVLRRLSPTAVIVQGDIPRFGYLLLQFYRPLIFIRQDGILTCPGNDRFLHRSRSVCRRKAGLGCFFIGQREKCLGSGGALTQACRLLLRIRGRWLLKGFRHFVVVSQYLSRNHSRAARVLYPPLLSHARGIQPRGPKDNARIDFAVLRQHPSTPHPARDLKRLVFCGRLEPAKGPLEAIRILSLLPEAYHLVMMGDGNERERVLSLAEQLQLRSRVDMKGWVDSAERDQILASAGVLVLPSQCDEAFGMVGLEAFAQGTPVVAYNVGGISEWCHYPAGIAVGGGDVWKAAEAVRSITERVGQWRIHSQAARKLVEREFAPERFGRDLQTVLDWAGASIEPQEPRTERQMAEGCLSERNGGKKWSSV